jgi:hypothetical protein
MTPATTVIAEIAASTKLSSSAISAGLGINPGDLINAQGLSDAEAEATQIAGGSTPTPLPDGDVLTAAEIVTVQNTINSYNQVIQQQVSSVGGTLVDLHAYFATFASGVSVNGTTATTAFLGGIFGLDGIHPTNTGYALLANQFIAALNSKFSLSIAAVNVNAIAAKDPYFGANIKPTGMTRIPTATALQAQHMLQVFDRQER